MATATINGVVFDGLSTEQIMALAGRFSPGPIEVCEPVREVIRRAEPNSGGKFEVVCGCGHTIERNSPRGRKPSRCADCSSAVRNSAPKATPAPRRNSQPRRKWSYSEDDSWMDNPMSNKQRDRILGKLEKVEIDSEDSAKIIAAVNREPRITMGQASKIWQALKGRSAKS